MVWFKYTSLTTSEIFEKINYISIEPFPWILFIIISIILVFLNINYFFPIILFSVEHFKQVHTKKEKRKMIKQIALQREVEDEIEKSFIKK
jgi:hypothetical protein